MKKIEMYIRPEKLETVKEILNDEEIYGMTVTMVSGCGRQKGRKEFYRGTEVNLNLLPKVKIETVVCDDVVDTLIDKVTKAIRTGEVGDGKVFVFDVIDAIKIRTGETGDAAITDKVVQLASFLSLSGSHKAHQSRFLFCFDGLFSYDNGKVLTFRDIFVIYPNKLIR